MYQGIIQYPIPHVTICTKWQCKLRHFMRESASNGRMICRILRNDLPKIISPLIINIIATPN